MFNFSYLVNFDLLLKKKLFFLYHIAVKGVITIDKNDIL